MFDTKKLEELHQNFMKLVAASPAGDIERNTRAMLSSFFSKLDLVTRDEFDLQTERVNALEARIKALESGQ